VTAIAHEKIWLPDLLLAHGRLERGLALVADAAGTILRLSREPADLARAERLAGRALLPGFVNAHSHAFQRAIRGRTEQRTRATGDTFWTWREKMYHAATVLDAEGVYATARMAFLEMALAGTTTVGEFHYLHHAPGGGRYPDPNLLAKEVVRAAREIGLRIALLHCGYARAGWKRPPHPGQARFLYRTVEEFLEDVEALRLDLRGRYQAGEVWVGIAPHSLRAVPLRDFIALNRHGTERRLPVHMHVSEQRRENEECSGEHGLTPIALLAREGLLHAHFTAVHAVHVSPSEIEQLAAAGAGVCACPTTERNLGDGIVPADQLTGAGVRLALGSDSQIQIDPLEDARELEYHLRLQREERAVLAPSTEDDGEEADALARRLLTCATAAGARALGTPGGALEPGRPGDFFPVDLCDPSIAGLGESLGALVFSLERTAIRDVAVGGDFILRDGRHALQRAVVDHFSEVQRQLWEKRGTGVSPVAD